VTNTFPATAQLLSASITPGPATTVTNANGFSFNNIPLDTVTPIQIMTVMAEPTQVGLFTNTVVVAVFGVTNITHYLVTQVLTNAAVVTQADLAVAMTGPSALVFSNDWMVYGVSVTNLGPGTAPNVMLTNTLPTNVGYKSVSPAHTRLGIGTNVVFSLGTLASGAFTNLYLTVQPTNAGVLPFSSFVNSSSVTDTNLANNSASINVGVSNFFSGQLTAYTNSGQIYNSANGLVEQSILVSNVGTNAVAAVRVVVTGLTNLLYNALGTNNGNPFVVYAATLDTNQSVNLLLQYFSPTRSTFAFTNSQLHPFAVSVPNLAPPPAAALSTNLNITRILRLAANGDMLIEFPTTNGATYTVVYSDNVMFSNAMIAPPAITAFANRLQWVDYGPPTTVSHPTTTPMRFYRVFLNP
jgi:uncharacterized repeat protein (TIGR01451 family)